MARLTIKVYAKRGSQPAYSYVAYSSVKPSKATDLAAETAEDILAHETRSGAEGSITALGSGFIIRINHGQCRFAVRATR